MDLKDDDSNSLLLALNFFMAGGIMLKVATSPPLLSEVDLWNPLVPDVFAFIAADVDVVVVIADVVALLCIPLVLLVVVVCLRFSSTDWETSRSTFTQCCLSLASWAIRQRLVIFILSSMIFVIVNLPLSLKISFPGVFIVNVVESSSDGDIIAFFNVYF